MFRRGNTQNAPSLETSNQTQIDDLVQRNRTLEQTNKQLTEQLNLEHHRAKEAVAEIQEQLLREQRQWREGCDVLVSCHRIAHLRTIAELETAKTKVLVEEEARRREKVQRLKRDVKITTFQIREGELEDKIADLEDEKEELVAYYDEAMAIFCQKLSILLTQRNAQLIALRRLEKERDQIQDKSSHLHQENATLQTLADSTSMKLERVTLQLESAQSKNTELERTNDDLRRGNGDLQRQLERWQNLEKKGDHELETLRKQKIALEVKLSNLEDRLDKQNAEKETELVKARKREEKITKQWQDEVLGLKSQREKAENALAEAHKRIKQLEADMKKLSSTVDKGDEVHVTDNIATDSKSRQTRRLRSPPGNRRGKRSRVDGEDGYSDSSKLPRADPGKTNAKSSPASEVEETTAANPPTTKKPTGARDNSKKTGKRAAKDVPHESVTEGESVIETRPTPKAKRQRNASTSDEDAEVEILGSKPPPPKNARQKSGRGNQKLNSKANQDSRNKPNASSAEESDSARVQAPAKKKRKINIFSNPAEPTFAFTNNDTDIGLDIPTTLSPVKDMAGIPGRSASVMSRIMSNRRLKG